MESNLQTPCTPWELVLNDLQCQFEIAYQHLEKCIAIWETNPDDPECKFMNDALEKSELKLTITVMLADPNMFKSD